jgi:hypothetical protein
MTNTESSNKLPFLNGTKVLLKKIPKYPLFAGEFIQNIDITLCKMIIDTPDIAPVENIDGFKSADDNHVKTNEGVGIVNEDDSLVAVDFLSNRKGLQAC